MCIKACWKFSTNSLRYGQNSALTSSI